MALVVVTCDSDDHFLNVESLDEACGHLIGPLSHLRFKVRDMENQSEWTDVIFPFDDVTKEEIRDCLSLVNGAYDVYHWRHFQGDFDPSDFDPLVDPDLIEDSTCPF